jgi:hypothetical protein
VTETRGLLLHAAENFMNLEVYFPHPNPKLANKLPKFASLIYTLVEQDLLSGEEYLEIL